MPNRIDEQLPCIDDGKKHGVASGYTRGCRGSACREPYREYQRAYQAKRRLDPEYRAKSAEARRLKPEASRRATRNYILKNPDHMKKWRLKNPHSARDQNYRRRARVRGANHGCVKPDFIEFILTLPCAYCGAICEQIDHAYPISRGGLHCVENLQPSCARCNRVKNASVLATLPLPLEKCNIAGDK